MLSQWKAAADSRPSYTKLSTGVVVSFYLIFFSDCAHVMPFQFSKGKFWLDPPSEKLRKQLEEELRLSGSNLKSHAWYHGHIPWEVRLECPHTHRHTHAISWWLNHETLPRGSRAIYPSKLFDVCVRVFRIM